MEYIEKLNTKKEYTAPQMDVVSCDVQRFLCDSDDGGIVEKCTEGVDC